METSVEMMSTLAGEGERSPLSPLPGEESGASEAPIASVTHCKLLKASITSIEITGIPLEGPRKRKLKITGVVHDTTSKTYEVSVWKDTDRESVGQDREGQGLFQDRKSKIEELVQAAAPEDEAAAPAKSGAENLGWRVPVLGCHFWMFEGVCDASDVEDENPLYLLCGSVNDDLNDQNPSDLSEYVVNFDLGKSQSYCILPLI